MQNQSCFGGRLIVAPLVHLLLIPSTPMQLKLINNPLCYLTDQIIIRDVQLKSLIFLSSVYIDIYTVGIANVMKMQHLITIVLMSVFDASGELHSAARGREVPERLSEHRHQRRV